MSSKTDEHLYRVTVSLPDDVSGKIAEELGREYGWEVVDVRPVEADDTLVDAQQLSALIDAAPEDKKAEVAAAVELLLSFRESLIAVRIGQDELSHAIADANNSLDEALAQAKAAVRKAARNL
jgi:hypothetical protein